MGGRPVRRYLLLAVTVLSGTLLVGLWRHSPISVLLVGVSTGGAATLAVLERRAARARQPEGAIEATTGSYTIGSEYAFPWYAGWALPVMTDHEPTPLAWVVWAQAAVMLAALKLPIHPSTTILDTTMRGTITYAAPLVVLWRSSSSASAPSATDGRTGRLTRVSARRREGPRGPGERPTAPGSATAPVGCRALGGR